MIGGDQRHPGAPAGGQGLGTGDGARARRRRRTRGSSWTVAVVLALVLLAVTGFQALRQPVPYVTFSPGPTVNVLGDSGDEPIIEVEGRRSYRDDGALRLVTVVPSGPGNRVDLVSLLRGWVDPAVDVLPYDSVYQPQDTRDSVRQQSAAQMSGSQENAVAAALGALGVRYDIGVGVSQVDPDGPAAGRLEPGDQVLRVGGRSVSTTQGLVDAVRSRPVGSEVDFTVRRDGRTQREQVTTVAAPGGQDGSAVLVGISPCCYDFPVDVRLNLADNIGGPSAGMMFALGIYDVLTPGSLTDGEVVAGTGEIDPEGNVGPIGGIRQKLVGAQSDGARLFLVPGDNCAEALTGDYDPDRMRLVRADTLDQAISDVKAWVADPDADLPSCEPGDTT